MCHLLHHPRGPRRQRRRFLDLFRQRRYRTCQMFVLGLFHLILMTKFILHPHPHHPLRHLRLRPLRYRQNHLRPLRRRPRLIQIGNRS